MSINRIMADGRQGGAAGAASHSNAVILSKPSGVRRPQLSNSCKELKRNYVFYLQYSAMIVSYVAALLIISVRPCWDDTISLLPENINTKHIGSPFHGSGQYTAYHNVLNNGQVYLAPYSTEPLRRNKHKSNIYRKLLNYLFTTLLLSGDVQLNPGPNITEPAIRTGVESGGWPRPLIVAAVEVVALNSTLHVTQKPRFYGVKTNRNVTIFCMVSDRNQSATVEWYKASEYNTTRKKIEGDRVTVRQKSMLRNALIELSRVETEDTGLYFCLINNITWGPGTELQVFRPSNAENAERRSKLKDALIFLQALLLTLFALVPLLRHQSLLKKEDAIYEEPEHDHIYEGLEIEHCGGLYEDISAYAQPGPAEAAAAWKQE